MTALAMGTKNTAGVQRPLVESMLDEVGDGADVTMRSSASTPEWSIRERLGGCWRLARYNVFATEGGETARPLGDNPFGTILYTPDARPREYRLTLGHEVCNRVTHFVTHWATHRVASARRVADNPYMPRISAFYGIVITMYFRDHPPPHFHARYGEHAAEIAIDTLAVIDGWLPPRALRLVGEWAGEHRDELRANWDRARTHDALAAIDPLP